MILQQYAIFLELIVHSVLGLRFQTFHEFVQFFSVTLLIYSAVGL